MKYFYLTIFLISTILLSACATKEVKPTVKKTKSTALNLSKINYPKKIGNYELESKKSFENSALGITIRYIDTEKTKAYLDCHIYPQGKDKDLNIHYNELISALKYMHKAGELTAFKILKEDSISLDASHTAKRAVFEMENRNIAYYSVVYLSKVEDHYFKIRISNPKKTEFLQSDFGEKTVKELFKNIKFNK